MHEINYESNSDFTIYVYDSTEKSLDQGLQWMYRHAVINEITICSNSKFALNEIYTTL